MDNEENIAALKMGKDAAILEMELTPFMEGIMKEVFEIEMLQGESELLPDGRIKWIITIEDTEKADRFKEWMINTFFADKIVDN